MPTAEERWNGFLAQITERHAQVRIEAEALGLAYASPDATSLSNQLMGLRNRMQDLETKIIDAWHAKVSDVFYEEGATQEAVAAQYDKGNDVKHMLDDKREEIEIKVIADHARRHGLVVPHQFAQEVATPEWRAMVAAQRSVHAIRPPRPLDPIVRWERAQIAYWRAYLAARARYEPAIRGSDLPFEISPRMEPFYVQTAEYEPAWVAAGRPRSAL